MCTKLSIIKVVDIDTAQGTNWWTISGYLIKAPHHGHFSFHLFNFNCTDVMSELLEGSHSNGHVVLCNKTAWKDKPYDSTMIKQNYKKVVLKDLFCELC